MEQSDWLDREMDELALDEDLRLKAYLDTVGVWTIGVGHTGGVKKGDTTTKQQAMAWLEEDVQEALDDAKAVCGSWWKDLSGPRKGVMVNMCFNMGRAGVAGFKNTLRYISQGEYAKAATNMMMSKWASQVGKRANRLAHRMETNTYAAR